MRVLILTGYDTAYAPLGIATLRSKAAYAEQHGYSFVCHTDYENNLHPAFQKLGIILKYLDTGEYDYVFWQDADLVVTNLALTVEEIISQTSKDTPFIAPFDWGHVTRGDRDFTTCSFLCKNTARTKELLCNATILDEEWGNTPLWDQHALQDVVFPEDVFVCPQPLLASVPSFCRHYHPLLNCWKPGDFAAHLTCCGGIEDKLQKLNLLEELLIPYPKKTFHVVTLASPEIFSYALNTEDNKREYANIHGYSFTGIRQRIVEGGGAWSKPAMLLDLWDSIEEDYIFYADADTVITNMTITLESIVKDSTADLIISEDYCGPCMGIFFIKKTAAAKKFLQQIFAGRREVLHHHWCDQQAAHKLMKSGDHDCVIDLIPAEKMNSQPKHGFHPDHFILHMAGDVQHRGRPSITKQHLLGNAFKTQDAILKLLSLHFPPTLKVLGLSIGVHDVKFIDHLLASPRLTSLIILTGGLSEREKLAELQAALKKHPQVPRMISGDMLDLLSSWEDGSLHFIHIAGPHTYGAALDLISLAWKKLKPGGILMGANYLNERSSEMQIDVKTAVLDFVWLNKLKHPFISEEEHPKSWLMLKPA